MKRIVLILILGGMIQGLAAQNYLVLYLDDTSGQRTSKYIYGHLKRLRSPTSVGREVVLHIHTSGKTGSVIRINVPGSKTNGLFTSQISCSDHPIGVAGVWFGSINESFGLIIWWSDIIFSISNPG